MLEDNETFDRAAFFADWIKALRSNEYQQTQRQLYYRDAYCCLGIACHLAGLAYEMFRGARYYIFKETENAVTLPMAFAARLDIDTNGKFFIDPLGCSLTTLNDNSFTFAQIADVIEYVERYQLWT